MKSSSVGVSSAARVLRAAGWANVFAQSAKRKVIGGAEEARFAAREGARERKNPLEPGIGIIRNSGFPTGCRRIVKARP